MDSKRLPNLFIVGAPKAGTTSLYDILKQYPQVYFPVQKEPSFFSDDEYFENGVDWYIDTFYAKSAGFKYRGDATPRYLFFSRRVVPRLAPLYAGEKPKIIAVFRDPADLVYSYYWQNVREGREELSFPEALSAENRRMEEHRDFLDRRGRFYYAYSQIASYASQLQPYLEFIPNQNRLFILTEDLKDFPRLIDTLERFLELEKRDWPAPIQSNVASVPRIRWLHQLLIQKSRPKEIIKKVVPYALRHQMKMAAIQVNLKTITPAKPAPQLMNGLRKHYLPETRLLETILERDLSTWYPKSENI